jgi:hypothetical protein
MLACAGEAKFAARLQEIVVVASLAGIACLIDGPAGAADIAQARCRAAVLEVKLCAVRAASKVPQAALGRVAGLTLSVRLP